MEVVRVHYGRKWKKTQTSYNSLSHKRGSERNEQASERRSEWPSTSVWILGCSGPQCGGYGRWVGVQTLEGVEGRLMIRVKKMVEKEEMVAESLLAALAL